MTAAATPKAFADPAGQIFAPLLGISILAEMAHNAAGPRKEGSYDPGHREIWGVGLALEEQP